MKRFIFLALPLCLWAENLQTLLEYAKVHNNLIVSKTFEQKAEENKLKSTQNSYYPTLDASAFYQRDDKPTPFRAGTTYGAQASLSWEAYDGGQRHNTLAKQKEQLQGAQLLKLDTQHAMSFAIVKDFYALQTQQARLEAREEAAKAVASQLKRVKSFFEAKLATSEQVDRLQAAYDANRYEIDALKFEILSLKKHLELVVGKKIEKLDFSAFTHETKQEHQELPAIQALKKKKNALLFASKALGSVYYPHIELHDTYKVYGYGDEPNFGNLPIELLDSQNTITATLALRVFDFGRVHEAQEALKLQAQALAEVVHYQSKEQQMQLALAYAQIQTAHKGVQSSKSALRAAKSAFESIAQKYQAGLVDNVVYLDALASKTNAQARYKKARNDVEMAYARLYYYQGKDLEEMLR